MCKSAIRPTVPAAANPPWSDAVELAVKTGLVRVYVAKFEQGEQRPDAGEVGAMHLAASPACRHEGNVGEAPTET